MVSEIQYNPKVEILLHHRVMEIVGNSLVEGLWVQNIATKEKKASTGGWCFYILGW